jgi:hypothetical protein
MSRCARRARSLSESFRTLDPRLRIGLAMRKGYRERGIAPDGTAMALGFSAGGGGGRRAAPGVPPCDPLPSRAAAGRRVNAVVRRDGSQRAQETIVLGVSADPEPDDDIAVDNA